MTIDLSVLLKKFLLERRFASSSHGQAIQINNPKIIGSMHYIDKIFIEKNSLITNQIELVNFLLNTEYYPLDGHQKKAFKKYFNDHIFSNFLVSNAQSSQPCSDQMIPDEPHSYHNTCRTETKPLMEMKKSLFLNINYNDDLRHNKERYSFNLNKYNLEFAMKTLLLCHSTKTEFNQKEEKLIHDTLFKEHDVILKFCSELDLNFCGNIKLSESKYNCYKLKLCQNIFYYFILSTNEFTQPRNRFSIIISEDKDIDETEQFTLLICSYDLESLMPNLKLSNVEAENLKETLYSMREKGMKSLVYATKTLTKEELNNFLQSKNNLELEKNDLFKTELDSLYNSLEQKLEIVLIVNYKETLKISVYENIAALKDAQMKYFLLSRDSETSTMATAYNSGIIDKSSSIKKFIATNNKSAILLMKHFLNNLRKELENHHVFDADNPKKMYSSRFNYKFPKFFTLILDGSTLEIILKSAFLKENLKFILIWIQNIICFQIKPEQKHELIKYIKSASLTSNSKILALGSSFEDLQMFKEADVSIEINDKGNYISNGENDIILNDFERLGSLILVKGPLLYKKIEKIILLFLFIFELILFLRFFFEFFSSLSLSFLISDESFHLTGIILTFMSIIYFCYSNNPQNAELLESFPIIYQGNALKKKYNFIKLTIKTLIPGILVALCFLSINILYSNDEDEGNVRSFTEVQSMLFITVIMVTYVQVIN